MRKRKVSASSTATNNNIAVVASSTSPGPFNLGQILAKYGYVPRATFRPNIPPPTSSVLPPLQPTTTGIGTLLNGLPQPTSYFTQPILRNDICYTPEQLDLALFLQQQQRYPFRRIQQQLYQDALTFENQNIYEVCGNVGSECCDSNEEEEGEEEEEEKEEEEKEVGKCVEEEGKEEKKDEKENDENEKAVPQLQLKKVGQNENIIRQQAKETGVEVSPVLVPSSIPRITDDPRINGKGASSISNNQVTTAAVINRRISSPPPQTPIAGGGGFKGFQRQESVEAYQLAMAANGLNKQKRQHFEEKMMELIRKLMKANSIEQKIPKSLLNSYGLRRSEGPPPQQQSSLSSTCNIQQLCPLSEATISLNWRQHEAGNTNKSIKQQQKLSADLRQTNIQQQQQWTQLHSLSQQHQHSSSSSALITRNVQPLLSLSQALNSSGQQHPPYSFNQFVQQLQAGNSRKIFDRNKTSYGGRDQATILPPFRGAQNTNPYKPRTWSTSNSDWLNKQQKLGNNEGGGQWQGGGGRNVGIKRQHQQQQQRWIDNDGIGIKGGSTSSKTVMRRSGSEYNVNNNTPIVMANNNVLLQQQQQQQLFFDEKRGERGEMMEKHQRQQNKFLYTQQQQDGRQQPKKGRPPFASSNRPTRPTSIRFPEGNNMSTEKEFGVVIDQHNFSNLKGLNKIDEQKYDEQQQQQPSSYNFEEHVEEFPALSLSQTNSRKASECHSEQPSPSSPKLLLDQQQQQASLFSIKQPFSVVVAGGGNGGRPRRATIGTSTATCTTICGDSRKMNNNENVYLTVGEQATRTPRSDTISCGGGSGLGGSGGMGGQQKQQLLLGQQRRSYAQAMLKRNNGSGVGVSVVTGGEEERSAKDRKNSTCKEGIENNNNQDDNNTNFPPISSLGTEV
uniref:Uncharacterized protein n=1 Tax=Meloidogyne enterolobii TaxID=390850 RepID=A0A6V7TM28_MELEN|nr:unnamed protein product [Meloidogyne enterolobii]